MILCQRAEIHSSNGIILSIQNQSNPISRCQIILLGFKTVCSVQLSISLVWGLCCNFSLLFMSMCSIFHLFLSEHWFSYDLFASPCWASSLSLLVTTRTCFLKPSVTVPSSFSRCSSSPRADLSGCVERSRALVKSTCYNTDCLTLPLIAVSFCESLAFCVK